jgi:hypothetical protein
MELNDRKPEVNIYNIDKYTYPNIFNIIEQKNIIVYFMILLIILFIQKSTNNFGYVFISICLSFIYIYYNQKISYTNYQFKKKQLDSYVNELNIDPNSLLARDKGLVNILYEARFIKSKSDKQFAKLIDLLENFFITFETLKQNVNNIFLKPTDMIKPFKLNKIQQSILLNDLRDHLERILKHVQTVIYTLPDDKRYLDSYYNFSQLLKNNLSKYYNFIMTKYKFIDHTSQYQVIRTSEDKYGFIDEI